MTTTFDSLFQIVSTLLPFLCIGSILIPLFLIYGAPALLRFYLQLTGVLAYAKILQVRTNRSEMVSAWLGLKEVIAELEIHPQNGDPYVALDRYRTWTMDFFPLRRGCLVQVRVAPGSPKRVACLPDTILDPTDEPTDADGKLDRLMAMLNVGMISQPDFDAQKAKILSGL